MRDTSLIYAPKKAKTAAADSDKTESPAAGSVCTRCGTSLSHDEIALTKKLVNRGTTRYYCLSCLAAAFEVSEQDLQNKIRFFKRIGCTLFHPDSYE